MFMYFIKASLVGHVDNLKLLRDGVCYIEFGAGKGGLSHWVQRASPDCKNNKYFLVEKGSIRYICSFKIEFVFAVNYQKYFKWRMLMPKLTMCPFITVVHMHQQ